jgi:hypothetical protein
VADFPVGLPFADKLEHLGRETVRLDALARPPTEHDAALPSGAMPERTRSRSRSRSNSANAAIREAMSLPWALRRSNCRPVWATNETSQACRSCRVWNRSSIERPQRVSSVTRMTSILRAWASARIFLALGPIVLGAGGGFLPDADDLVAGLLGEGLQVPLLAGTGLVGGRYPAVERGGLSQLNPLGSDHETRRFCGFPVAKCHPVQSVLQLGRPSHPGGTPMPRRELLTPTERVQLFAFPSDEGELIRLATLAPGDLTYIRQHRGDHNRLGLAIQMVYLRHPSRVLPPSEAPYPPLLGIVAAQLKATPAAWSQYAKRDETRREHLQELLERFELQQFDRSYYRELIDWLMPLALQTTQGLVLAHAVANELRARRILLPTVALIEKMCAIALTRAERGAFRRLTSGLTDKHRAALDAVLLVRPGGSSSTLSWFRQPPGAPSANAVLAHLARLRTVRGLDLPADLGRDVHQNRLLRLAREGAQTAVFQLQEYDPLRRYATLVAILLDTTATLTDETLELHDRLIGTFFSKARSKYDREFAADGQALNDKVRLYAKIGSALIASKAAQTDPFAAIESVIPWDEFTASVAQAEKLSRDEAFDPLALLTDYFSTLRKYAPAFLEAFQFRGAPVAQSLLDAIDLLRAMNQRRRAQSSRRRSAGVRAATVGAQCRRRRRNRPSLLRTVRAQRAQESPARRRLICRRQPPVPGLRGLPDADPAFARCAAPIA